MGCQNLRNCSNQTFYELFRVSYSVLRNACSFYIAKRTRNTLHAIILMIILSFQISYGEIIDKLIAVVAKEAITLSALENELKMRGLSFAKEAKRREVLEDLIDRKLILFEARRMGLELAITINQIEAQVDALKIQFSSEQDFLAYLEKEGLSVNEIKEEMRDSLMSTEMKYRKFMRPLEADSDLFARKALAYYQNNQQKYVEPEKVKFQQVVVLISPVSRKTEESESRKVRQYTTRNDVTLPRQQESTFSSQYRFSDENKIWRRLEQGLTFSQLHQNYSDDTDVIVDYEPDYKAVDKLIPELQKAISTLEIGDLSQPIATEGGYFIVRLMDHKPVRQMLFDEVADQIKSELMMEQVQKDLDEWLIKRRTEADIRIIEQDG